MDRFTVGCPDCGTLIPARFEPCPECRKRLGVSESTPKPSESTPLHPPTVHEILAAASCVDPGAGCWVG